MNAKCDSTVLSTHTEFQRCYRLRRRVLIIGVVSTVSCLMFGVTSACAAYWNIDGSFARPRLAAVIFSAFWSCVTLLGMWLIVAYVRCRLYVTDSCISEVGLVASTTIEIDDANRVVWRLIPSSGSVVIRSIDAKIKIGFDDYTPNERDELITFCRTRFRPEIQEGWSQFVERFLEPNPKRERHSRVAMLVLLLNLTFFAGSFVYLWLMGRGVQYLVLGIVNALVVLWYLWRRRVSSPRGTHTSK